MKIKVYPIEKTNVSLERVLTLIKLAFQERKEQGLNYGCLSLSLDGFQEEVKDSMILIATDEDSDVLCGCSVLMIRCDKDGNRFGWEKHTSVHPEYKGKGVGSLLINSLKAKAIELDCEYLGCSTAVDAESAIRVHLKNGYYIVGLKSFRSTNYYSYMFRMQLTPSCWSDPLYCKKQYKKSRRKIRVAYKADGSKTILGRLLANIGVNW